MTLRELIAIAGSDPRILGGTLGVPPLLAFVTGLLHRKGAGGASPWKYGYMVLVYLACVPAVMAAMLTLFTLLFTRENLLDVDATVYLLPIVSGGVTLALVRRRVSFDEIPGFDRLWGLIVMLALTFAVVFALSRTHLWLFFGGSILLLGALVAGVFALIKWGAYMAFRGRDEPKVKPPSIGLPR